LEATVETTLNFAQLSPDQKAEYLLGGLDSLRAFMLAVILTHPEPSELKRHWEGGRGRHDADVLHQPVPEAFIAGRDLIAADIDRLFAIGEAESEAKRARGG
jgi:hypothetical protein